MTLPPLTLRVGADGRLGRDQWRHLGDECSALYKENLRTWQELMSFTDKAVRADRCNCNAEPELFSSGGHIRFATKRQYAEFMIQMFVCSNAQIRYAPDDSITRRVRNLLDTYPKGYSARLMERWKDTQREITENGLTQAGMALAGVIATAVFSFAVGFLIAVVLAVVFFFYSFNRVRQDQELADIQSEHAKSNLGKMVEAFAKNVTEPTLVVQFWNEHRASVHAALFSVTRRDTIYISDTRDLYSKGAEIPPTDTGFAGVAAS